MDFFSLLFCFEALLRVLSSSHSRKKDDFELHFNLCKYNSYHIRKGFKDVKVPQSWGRFNSWAEGRDMNTSIPTWGKARPQVIDTLLGSCSHTLTDHSAHTLLQTSHGMSRHLPGQGVPRGTGAAGNSAQRGDEEIRNAHSAGTRHNSFISSLDTCLNFIIV